MDSRAASGRRDADATGGVRNKYANRVLGGAPGGCYKPRMVSCGSSPACRGKGAGLSAQCPGAGGPWRRLAVFVCLGLAWGGGVTAGEPVAIEAEAGPDGLTLRLPDNVAAYYRLDLSTNLPAFSPWAMDLGHEGAVWRVPYDSGPDAAFFRAFGESLWSPLDTDGDGMDDVWELDHPGVLDPLDPADAGLDPDGNGLSHLQEYWSLYGRRVPRNEAISREWTLFNFESPLARFEAISREVTLYVGQPGP